ncbi:MAG: NnrU family protein [Proteobacteria bacterium]|nr:NnrU family protein [Pseudomonadota bacterium]
MLLLITGLVLFLGVHMLTTARHTRGALMARLGEGAYKGLYSIVAAAGLVLIVWGFGRYRSSGYIPVWDTPAWLLPIALVLMWFSFVALVATYAQAGKLKGLLRHPMLAGIKAWALAHLLVNGDLGSIILFGAFLAWAVYDRIAVKRRGDTGAPRSDFTLGDAVSLLAGSALYASMFWLHPWLIGVPIT